MVYTPPNTTSGTAPGFAPTDIAQVPEEPSPFIREAIELKDLQIEKVPLKELGNTLPEGILLDKTRLTHYRIKPYTPALDREVSASVKNRSGTLMDTITACLPIVVESIGDIPVLELAKRLSKKNPIELFDHMSFGDVLTLICGVRVAQVGEDIAINTKCPTCGKEFKDDPEQYRQYHDLLTAEIRRVKNVPEDSPFVVKIPLPDGMVVGEDHITYLLARPMRWYEWRRIFGDKSGQDGPEVTMIKELVCGMPESEAYRNMASKFFTDALFDRMATPRNVAHVRSGVMKLMSLRPDMTFRFECNCGRGGAPWDEGVGWENLHQFFFQPADTPVVDT